MKVKDFIAELQKFAPDDDILIIAYTPDVIASICNIPLEEMPDFILELEDNLDTEGLQIDMQNIANQLRPRK